MSGQTVTCSGGKGEGFVGSSTDPFYYLVCPPYHGATLFSLFLNCHPAVTSLGDTIPKKRYLSAPCSCGKPVKECPFWNYVSKAVKGKPIDEDEEFLAFYPQIFDSVTLNKSANLLLGTIGLALGESVWTPVRNSATPYLREYMAFREVVKEWNGTSLFLDAGKSLVRVWVNRSLIPAGDTRLLHLVRDPRAYHASNLKNWGDKATIRLSCRDWKRKHRFIRWVGRTLSEGGYLCVRYEDLCQYPEETLSRILEFLNVSQVNLLERAKLAENQHVIGSSTKHRFDGTIYHKQSWKNRLTDSEAQSIIRKTEPYSTRFGYSESGAGGESVFFDV